MAVPEPSSSPSLSSRTPTSHRVLLFSAVRKCPSTMPTVLWAVTETWHFTRNVITSVPVTIIVTTISERRTQMGQISQKKSQLASPGANGKGASAEGSPGSSATLGPVPGGVGLSVARLATGPAKRHPVHLSPSLDQNSSHSRGAPAHLSDHRLPLVPQRVWFRRSVLSSLGPSQPTQLIYDLWVWIWSNQHKRPREVRTREPLEPFPGVSQCLGSSAESYSH